MKSSLMMPSGRPSNSMAANFATIDEGGHSAYSRHLTHVLHRHVFTPVSGRTPERNQRETHDTAAVKERYRKVNSMRYATGFQSVSDLPADRACRLGGCSQYSGASLTRCQDAPHSSSGGHPDGRSSRLPVLDGPGIIRLAWSSCAPMNLLQWAVEAHLLSGNGGDP